MPAFWHVPTGIWTINIEGSPVLQNGATIRIMIKCNGEAVAWGGWEYLDDMVTKFRQYQWAAGKPDCERCGHEYYDHLENHNCELMIYDPGTAKRHGRSACNWGGGHEGSCGCKGYLSAGSCPGCHGKGSEFGNCLCGKVRRKDAIFECSELIDVKKPPIWSHLKACLKRRRTNQ